VDECTAFVHIAAMLRDSGHIAHVIGTSNTWPTGTLDVEWIPLVGDRKWVLITKDKSIRKNEIELRLLAGTAVRTFVFTGANLNGDNQARVLKEALPAMLRLLRRRAARFIARVTAESNVELIQIEKYIHQYEDDK
jgi:hypothetical protein